MAADYEIVADEYDSSFELMPLRRHVEGFSVMRAVGVADGKSVLDLACGTGFYARALRRNGARSVLGVDLSAAMIGIANAAEQTLPQGIEYRVADASDLGELGSFDLALGIYLLHYASTRAALQGMYASAARNLRPGGRFVAFVMNPELSLAPGAYDDVGLRVRAPAPDEDGGPIHFSLLMPGPPMPELTAHRWNRETHESALHDAGFVDVAWTKPDVAPEGVRLHGEQMWAAYLEVPHCMLLTAVRR